MSVDPARGRREAAALAALLGHGKGIEAVVDRYLDFRAGEPEPSGGDRGLQLSWLRKGGLRARLASVWAGRFDRFGPMRRREVMMLALLECRPESFDSVDHCSDGGPLAAWPRLVFWGGVEVLLLVIALPFFATARLLGGRG